MILTRDIILDEIRKGHIVIDPFEEKNIGPASIDMRLDNKFRIFKKINRPVFIGENVDFENFSTLIELKDKEKLMLTPGETALGITIEKIKLPGDICGWIQGRSIFARMGLFVHVSSNFIQPGVENHQVLELVNVSPMPIYLEPGIKICQIVLQRTQGKALYKGRFAKQKEP